MPHILRPRLSNPTSLQFTSLAQPTRKRTTGSHTKPANGDRHVDNEKDCAPAFSATLHKVHLYDGLNRAVRLNFLCSISPGFFKVGHEWGCYRRNYITITANIHISEDISHLRICEKQVLARLALCVSAVVIGENPYPVELVQHTPKRDKGPQHIPEIQQVLPPRCQATWTRLQFKVATSNNGKKKGQQKFALKVNPSKHLSTLIDYQVALLGSSNFSGDNTWVEIAEQLSEPLIVRGRSPGHYNDQYHTKRGAPQSPNLPIVSSCTSVESSTLPWRSTMTADEHLDHATIAPYWHERESERTCKSSDQAGDTSSECSITLQPSTALKPRNKKRSSSGGILLHHRAQQQENQMFTLAPIRECDPLSRPKLPTKLPTYDELMSEIQSSIASSAAVKRLSPEVAGTRKQHDLEAALMLASISSSYAIGTLEDK